MWDALADGPGSAPSPRSPSSRLAVSANVLMSRQTVLFERSPDMTLAIPDSTSVQRPLLGERALVTGATGGLGGAIARALGRDGAHVLVLGRDADRGARTVTAIEEAGGRAEFVAADLSDPQRLAELAEEVGAIEILVNNAGFSLWGAT